jgi:YVTN family beta-propeller protein
VARVPLIAAIVLVALAASTPAHASPLAYVAQGGFDPSGAHALAVFDVATGAPVTSIDMPGTAQAVTIAPNGTRAYVATSAGLVVVDLTTNAIVAGPVADAFGGDLAVDPSGKRVYLADGQSKVRLFDTSTNTLTGSITVSDPQPRAIVANSAGTRAYTGNNDPPSYSIDTVDLTNDTNPVSTASGNFSRPENLGILPDGSKIYAANFGPGAGGNTVAIFDPAAVTVDSVTVGTTPTAAVANPSGTRVYVVNRDSSSISVIDVATSTVVDTFPIGFKATYLGIAPDGVHAVLSSQEDKVAFIDLATHQLYAGPTELSGSAGVAVAPAQTPVPSFAVKSGLSGDPTSFDASGSGGGPIARYDWDFGDGATAPDGAAKLTHVYAKAGTYDARLTETNQCDASAVVGPLGVAFAGHSPYCRGPRTDSKLVTITIPEAAVGVVVTNKAKAGGKGVAALRLACVKELACRGTLSLKTTKKFKLGKRPRARVTLGSKPFGKVAAGKQRTIKLKLSRAGLALLRSRKKLAVTATVRVPNPGGIVRVRSHELALRRG